VKALVATIASLALCACGATTQSATTEPSPPPGPDNGFDVLVTQRDQAITVRTGQTIEVYLVQQDGMSVWGPVMSDDEDVLRPIATGITVVRGATIAGFEAARPGTATIRSTAGPQCSPGQACPMYAVLFSVRVTVT
jgi:hypothetical protein